MSFSVIVILLISVIFVLVAGFILYKKMPRKLKVNQYVTQWKILQGYCKDKTTWSKAILEADKLLDKALKKRKYNGKSMGERLVSAQRKLTNNDGVWFAHNLSKKIKGSSTVRPKEAEVKQALIAFRQALKDIGALPNGESRDT